MRKSFYFIIILIIASQFSLASERAFRVDRYYPTVMGYAVAWGIPGKNLDFEKLDLLSSDEIERELDISLVKNFIVDLQTNQILSTVENEDMVVFNIGDIHFGNHYSISLEKLAIEKVGFDVDVIAVIENYKWSNSISKILLIDSSEKHLKTKEVPVEEMMTKMRTKLKESILSKNLDLFKNAAETITEIETTFLEKYGDVNIFHFDYTFPKENKNSLEVVATVKLRNENGLIVPYILSVEQKQY